MYSYTCMHKTPTKLILIWTDYSKNTSRWSSLPYRTYLKYEMKIIRKATRVNVKNML